MDDQGIHPDRDIEIPQISLLARRNRVAKAWADLPATVDLEPVFLLPSGLRLNIEGTDHEYRFRGHNDHRYLSGSAGPARVLVWDPQDGADGWRLFVPVPSVHDLVWIGDVPSPSMIGEQSGLSTYPLDEFAAWFADRVARPAALIGSWDLLERPNAYGLHPDDVDRLQLDADLHHQATHALHRIRRRKDESEVAVMRAAAASSNAGHEAAMRIARPGMTERDLQIELEAAMFRAGGESTAYGSIVLTGRRAAVLHGAPSHAKLADDHMVLIDAGAEIAGYDSDVTRTFPVAQRFSGDQRALYEVVLEAQKAAIQHVRPGVPFEEIHLATAHRLAEGLIELGVLVGQAEDLVERQAIGLFFPHGLGHLLGLATHDVGGRIDGARTLDHPGLATLRSRVDLEEGMVMTIEPGLYFIDALLDDRAQRKRFQKDVRWARCDELRALGGVRIEDDVLVTADGYDNLTEAIPKEVAAIEALRDEGPPSN